MPVGVKFAALAPVFTFTPTGSTVVTDLAPWTKDLSISQSLDKAESTGYGNTNKQYVATIADAHFDWTTFIEDGNVIEDLLIPGAGGSLIFGPRGSTVGKRKYTLVGFVDQFDPSYPYSDVATAATGFAPTGNLTRGVYP